MQNPERRILIVEDSQDLIDVWKDLFESHGYHVTACLDCKSAFECLHSKTPFDLVLSDYYLPDYNGLVLFDHVRKSWPDTPFLLVTGTREKFIYERIEKDKKAAVIPKPVTFKHLLEAAEKFFSSVSS